MTDEEKLFAALREARFVPLVSDQELERRSRQVARRIRKESRREWFSGIHRWWLAVIAGCVLVVAGVGAAGAGLLHRMPEQQDVVWCYRWVPKDLTDEKARSRVALLSSELTTAQVALDLCYSNGDGTMRPIPDVVSQCVLDDGNVAVIPLARCSDIGLPASDLKPATTN